MIRVVVVEDSMTQLDFCRSAVQLDPSLKLVAALGTAEEALARVDWSQVDVLLTDLELPGASGVALIQQARTKNPRLMTLPLTIHDDVEILFAALDAGAMGYLLKGVAPDEIVRAIHDLSAGWAPITPAIGRHLIAAFQGPRVAFGTPNLSPREAQVLRQMALGHSYKEIANHLSISPHTVNDHLKNVYAKLQTGNRAETLRKARLLGYLNSPVLP